MVDITTSGGTYTFNAADFREMGHARIAPAEGDRPAEQRFPDRVFGVLNEVLEDASGVATDTAAAEAARDAAQGFATDAETARDAAVAAAVSTDFPFGVTDGTATAFHLDLEPDRVVAAGFACRVQFHVDNEAGATFQVDDSITAPLTNIAGVAVGEGSLKAGQVYIVYYDATTESYKVIKQRTRADFIEFYALEAVPEKANNIIAEKDWLLYGINAICGDGDGEVTIAIGGVDVTGLVDVAVTTTRGYTAATAAPVAWDKDTKLTITTAEGTDWEDLFVLLDLEEVV